MCLEKWICMTFIGSWFGPFLRTNTTTKIHNNEIEKECEIFGSSSVSQSRISDTANSGPYFRGHARIGYTL